MTIKKQQDALIAIGSSIKALGDGRIGGHLVLFGSPASKDLYGDYFTPETYFGPSDGDGRDVAVNHRIPLKTGDPTLDQELKALSKRLLSGHLKTSRDAVGVLAEVVCDMSDEYERAIYQLAEKGKLKWSAGAAPHMVEREPDGQLKMFVISEGSLTPVPAEPRMLDHRVMPLKAFLDLFNQPVDDSGGTGAAPGAPAGRKPAGSHPSNEVKTMDILAALKKLMPDLTPEQVDQIAAILGLTGMAVTTGDSAPVDETTGEPMRSIPLVKLVADLKSLGYPVQLPGMKAPKPAATTRPPYDFKPGGDAAPEEDAATKSLNAAYMTRFGEEGAAKQQILSDVIGKEYRQQLYVQETAYAKYLRHGERDLEGGEYRALKSMYFPTEQIVRLVKEGYDTKSIKATQVEAIGELGGFAIPPQRQAEIDKRSQGLTAVRSAGARVVQLTTGSSIEIPVYYSDDTTQRYIGTIRGQWGDETAAPGEQNFKLKMVPVQAYVYTYKVPFSMSLVEDAANLVSLLNEDIAITKAVDEDDCFLVGDGVGKPWGWLPGGANTHGLTEIKSGAAALLTTAGIKALKRGVASQYRGKAVWVANSDSYGAIEAFVSTTGEFIFEDMSETEMLLSRKTYESEAMPDVAANTFPVLFGDMSGYTIVERLGMSIERMHDSYTGINKVEYHVRARIGGRPEKTYQAAVQKVGGVGRGAEEEPSHAEHGKEG